MTPSAKPPDTSAAVPAPVAALIEARLAAQEADWWQLALDLHARPELGLCEEYASGRLTGALDAAGFAVEQGTGGMATAFRADYGTGDLTLALTAEYDALPGLGHACGHNLIAALAGSAGTALAGAADELGIRVSVIGCPAEENAGGKIYLAEAGVFDDVHAVAQIHPANRNELCPATLANDTLAIRYLGQAAHASSFPERGRNAYDAVLIANVAIGLLRQQLPDSARVHALTGPSGPAVNIIPDDTKMTVKIRAADVATVAGISARVRACLDAGALGAGVTGTVTPALPRFAEIRYDRVLAALFAAACDRFAGHDTGYLRDTVLAGTAADGPHPAFYTPPSGRAASTDVGNLSWIVPTIQPMLRLDTSGGNHEASFADAACGPSARALLRDGAQALAATLAAAAGHRDYFLAEGSPRRRAERRAAAVSDGVLDFGVPLIDPPAQEMSHR